MPFETGHKDSDAVMVALDTAPDTSTNLDHLKGSSYSEGVSALSPVQMQGGPAAESYGITGQDGYSATGRAWGNRSGDLKNEEGVRKNGKKGLAWIVPKPDLSKLDLPKDRTDHYSSEGDGSKSAVYTEVEKGWGTASGVDASWPGVKYSSHLGTMISGPSAYGQAGGRIKHTAGVEGELSGDAGTLSGNAKAYSDAYIGASGKGSLMIKKGMPEAKLDLRAGLGYEAGVSAAGAYETPGLAIDGVTKDLSAGANASGQALVTAKAGVGTKLVLTPEEVTAKANAGAFAGAEAAGELGAHVGPIGGKVKGSALAGAGIGADAEVSYKDGVITFGASAWAALGLGGKVGFEVSLDVQQSAELAYQALKKARELGIKGAQAAFKVADADGDGRLTLNDAATHAGRGLEKGAETVASGIKGVTNFLDADGSGKFTTDDVKMRANQAKDYAVSKGQDLYNAGSDAWSATKNMASSAWDQTKSTVGGAVDSAKNALDADGDGELTRKDIGVMANKAGQKISNGVESAVYWSTSKAKELKEGADYAIVLAKQKMNEVAQLADRNNDGKVDMADLTHGASELYSAGRSAAGDAWDAIGTGANAAWDATKSGASDAWDATKSGASAAWDATKSGASAAWDATKSGASAVGNAVHGTLDVDGDGQLSTADAKAAIDAGWKKAVDTGSAIKRKAESVGSAIHNALDVDGSGSLGLDDAKAVAVKGVATAKSAYNSAKTTAISTYNSAKENVSAAYDYAKAKASEAKDIAHQTLDRDGDGSLGLSDVAAGANQAWNTTKAGASYVKNQAVATKDLVVKKTKQAYAEVSAQISRASDTLSSSWNTASSTVSDAWSSFTSLF